MIYFFSKRIRVLITSDNNYLIMNSQSNNILEEHCEHCKRSATECEKNTERERNPITHWEGTDADYCDDCYYNHYAEEVDSDEEEEVDSEEEEELEQLYCDYCCNQTNCISATEEGWVGDIETNEWKCVSCVKR